MFLKGIVMRKHKNLVMYILLVMIIVIAVGLVGCIATPSEASTAEDVSKDVSTEISESSVADVSEPSEASEVDESEPSNDPSEESDASAEPSDEPSDEVSKEQGDDPSAPDEASKEESSRPDEVSKEDEESRVEETSKNEETSKAEESTEPEHTHTWAQATCTAPKTCKTCGVTEGNATDHDWQSATCLAPQTCKVCGTTIGSVTAHLYENGACKYCGDEKEVVTGYTPVDIVINGKQESVGSYEEAVKALTLKDLENMAAGETIKLECNGVSLDFTAKGNGVFVDAGTGRACNAQRVYDFYISQYCSHCGKRAGDGTNGTCVRKLIDCECSRCGEFCKALECHTCGETTATKPAYDTFNRTIGTYNAYNLDYTDWKGDVEKAAFIETYTVNQSNNVFNALAAEFEKIYGFAPNLDDKFSCTASCEKMGVYIVDGYSEPQTVYHYTITDKTYIYITNDMYKVYTQNCDDGSVWVGFCTYATMDTVDQELGKTETITLIQEMHTTFEELIGLKLEEMHSYENELQLNINCISNAGTVRSIHSDGLVNVLYIYCRGFSLNNSF